jgi:transposase
MEVVHERSAGLDVHKRTVVACVQRPGAGGAVEQETRTFSTMVGQLELLAAWLREQRVSHVALEATGVYWKAVYNVLEGTDGWTVLVVNPEHVKAVTGRKTDRADAERLAFLLRHDLLRGSFIPAREQRELRELTRARTALVRERARVVQRLEKVLEGANIKLGAVVTELLGASGQKMLDAAVQGVTDPDELAGLAHPKLQPKRDLLVQALQGRLTRPLRFLAQQHLEHWRELDARIGAFDTEIAELLRPFDDLLARLDAIPGVGRRTAEVIVTEIGSTVEAFPSDRQLAAWAGLSPGNRQSGGRRTPARTRHGNPWLKAALTEAAWGASRCKDGYFPAQYRRLAPRRGRKRAIVAGAHSLITTIYFMLARGSEYHDLGSHYFTERDRTRLEQRARATLHALGFDVTLTPRSAPDPTTPDPATEAA